MRWPCLVGSAVFLRGFETFVWFAAATGLMLTAAGIANAVDETSSARQRTAAAHALFLVTMLGSCVYSGWFLSLWRSRDDAAQLFALVMVFVGFTYLLMQYYATPRIFAALISPYLATLAFIAGRDGLGPPPASGLAVDLHRSRGAGAVGLGNFTCAMGANSLDRSRTALREARAPAGPTWRAGRRCRQRGQERLPRHHEPRDPHAAQRRARHGAGHAGRRAQQRPARSHRHRSRVWRDPAGHPQRHPRPIQDRGRAAHLGDD